jgi:hypothetical protein
MGPVPVDIYWRRWEMGEFLEREFLEVTLSIVVGPFRFQIWRTSDPQAVKATLASLGKLARAAFFARSAYLHHYGLAWLRTIEAWLKLAKGDWGEDDGR